MEERDAVFRSKLIDLMASLNGGEGKDPALRRLIGGYAVRLARDSGAEGWLDLKLRADAPTYDSMLLLFQKQGETFQKAGDGKGVRALEVLGLSLIARYQQQPDLAPGVGFLDRYIEGCAESFGKSGKFVVTTRPAAH